MAEVEDSHSSTEEINNSLILMPQLHRTPGLHSKVEGNLLVVILMLNLRLNHRHNLRQTEFRSKEEVWHSEEEDKPLIPKELTSAFLKL